MGNRPEQMVCNKERGVNASREYRLEAEGKVGWQFE